MFENRVQISRLSGVDAINSQVSPVLWRKIGANLCTSCAKYSKMSADMTSKNSKFFTIKGICTTGSVHNMFTILSTICLLYCQIKAL